MTIDDGQRETLDRLLRMWQTRELDCDEFHDLLAAYVDSGLDDARVALMEHHREVCPECEEEHQLLRRSLGLP